MQGLSIRQLGIRFGRQAVIEGLDLEVEPGEFLVLLGPSGCGKSTLLHGIAGLVDVAAGQVLIDGRDMTAAEPADRGIGMVFQSYALYPTMTVERNLSFGVRAAGLPAAQVRDRVAQAAALLQLEPLLQRKPAQLSGGQRQRVAIGRALVRQAGIYLFDEPLSNLDAQLRAELRRELKLLHQRLGATMVYVTHDQAEALTLATRIVVMRAGRIEQIGSPAQVYAQPRNLFVAGFLGTPVINRIEGHLHTAPGGRRFVAPAFSLDLPSLELRASASDSQPATLALRAEHVQLREDGEFAARVQLVEPQGSHQVAWLDIGGASVSALVDSEPPLRAGDAVRVSIRREGVLLFDPATGLRLGKEKLSC